MGKKFSELERAVTLNNGDLAAFAQVDESAATGYKSKAAPMSLVSQKILKDTEYASDLQTDNKTVLGAINEAAMDKNIANPYSNQATYAVGDFVIYQTVLYKCITAVSVAEDFDSTKWTQAKVSDLVGAVTSNKMDKANPTGTGSLAVGDTVSASGTNSTALGKNATASGSWSFASGHTVTASASDAHAEGYLTKALATNAHAEGFSTEASGINAHAEGSSTYASGHMSHAEGFSSYATHKCQHVFGENNLQDDSSAPANSRGNYVEIVGNGADPLTRSNARTLGWDGHETIAGDLTFNAGTTPQHLTSELQNRYTKAQVDAIIDSILPTDEASGAVSVFKTSLTKPLVDIDVDNTATKIYQFGFNLFDKTTTIENAYISDSDGTQKPATGSKCTDYIPIVGDTEFYVRSDQTQGAWGAFYDENKAFISSWTLYGAGASYRAKISPANAKYVRFTIVRNNSGDENTFCFNVSGSDNGQYEAYNPGSDVYLVADKDSIVSFDGVNTIFADNGNVDVLFKCSVADYVNAHSNSGNRSLGVNLSKGSGENEPEELEEKDLKELKDDDKESGEIETISKK